MKSVHIRRFFWSVFSRIRTEYWDLRRSSLYSVNLHIQSEYRKIRTRKSSVYGQFSRSVHFTESKWKWEWRCHFFNGVLPGKRSLIMDKIMLLLPSVESLITSETPLSPLSPLKNRFVAEAGNVYLGWQKALSQKLHRKPSIIIPALQLKALKQLAWNVSSTWRYSSKWKRYLISMFCSIPSWQHYLKNKKPISITCICKHASAAIEFFKKMKAFCRITILRMLDFLANIFCQVV